MEGAAGSRNASEGPPPRATEPRPHTVAPAPPHAFPTVDVPDHAHYAIGSVILAIGITGILGNLLVIYAFSKSRSLRTPANMFIINLAVADLLMCLTQAPVFFTTSLSRRWIFGEKGCELYAFCGALFGICSMGTLAVIAGDRFLVITRPLTSLGLLSRRRALLVLLGAWGYALGWSLPPFFGWSAYVPEGLLTSCSWDYMSFTPAVRAYTMLLFIFVFFLPLFFIIYCYVFIFRAIRATNRAVGKAPGSSRDSLRTFRRLQSEWKMAKIALLVILLYVLSWAPYSAVALTAFAGYADMLTPYMNSVPAVIAKASAIHNPIIYAITHPKYRLALAKYVPLLAVVLCVGSPALGSSSSSFLSTRRSTVSSQSSGLSSRRHSNAKPRLSSASDSESALTDTENDLVSLSSRPASRQVSCDIIRDTELPDGRRGNRGGRDKASCDSAPTAAAGVPNGDSVDGQPRGTLSRIPSIVVTSESSPFLPIGRNGSRTSRPKTANSSAGAGPV